MKTPVLILAFAASMVCHARFEEQVLAMIDGLKNSVDRIEERSDSNGRALINTLQDTIDKTFETMGVAQNRAGYYLEQINELDAADTSFTGIRNDILQAKVKLASAESSVSLYRTWYDRLCSKVDEIISIRNQFLADNDFASWDWVKSNYVVENYVTHNRAYAVDPLLHMFNGGLDGMLVTLNYGSGLPSPNIEYGEKVCDGQCYCRQEHIFSGLEEARTLQENFDALASSWEQYNEENDIPD